MKILNRLPSTRSHLTAAVLAAMAALVLSLNANAAGKPKPSPGPYPTRFFEVIVFDEIWDETSNSWIENPARVFWQIDPREVGPYSDTVVRIGRIESSDAQGVLINHNVCGGRGGVDGCPAALALPSNLLVIAESGSNLSDACFTGDFPQATPCAECEVGTAAVHPPGLNFGDSAFRFNFEGRNTAGNKQQYLFQGFAISVTSDSINVTQAWSYQQLLVGNWVETEIGNWALARVEGPGGSQNACHGTGTFSSEGHRVRVRVTRIE